MRILITRPKKDSEHVAALLRTRGHEPILSPLMEVRFLDGHEISLEGVQAVLATSANGVCALAGRTTRRDIPIFAVGPQTAAAAREAGFVRVGDAQGDAVLLAEATARWSNPACGALLHITGREHEGALARTLIGRGYDVRTAILYEVVEQPSLSAEAAHALAAGILDAVMLYSPRSARIFADCVQRTGLAGSCRKLKALCISKSAADSLAPLAFAELRIASSPNQEAMLALTG